MRRTVYVQSVPGAGHTGIHNAQSMVGKDAKDLLGERLEVKKMTAHDHELVIINGVPGVYDILQCKNCGIAIRIAPTDVFWGAYPPDGVAIYQLEKVPCSRALEQVNPEFFPAYEKLFQIYKESNGLQNFLTDKVSCPKVDIGSNGVPKIVLEDGWSIEMDQSIFDEMTLVGIFHTIPDCGCGKGPCSPRVIISPTGKTKFIKPHGLGYDDQTTTPEELRGWERFKDLAMIMYHLPPPRPGLMWFGRNW